MLSQSKSVRQAPSHPPADAGGSPNAGRSPVVIGVGIDTSRYGHYAAFLRDDLQPAAAELPFAESADGYAQFRRTLEQIYERHGAARFVIRLDAAGQYADNLLHFLHALGTPPADAGGSPTAFAVTLSCGIESLLKSPLPLRERVGVRGKPS